MRRLTGWAAVSVIGFLVMVCSYTSFSDRADKDNIYRSSVMYIGGYDTDVNLPNVAYTSMPILILPLNPREEVFSKIASGLKQDSRKTFDICYSEKALPYFIFASEFKPDSLVWGRLPDANSNEAVAGFQTQYKEKVTIGGKDFKIVGRLRKGFAIFENTYLLGAQCNELFDANDENVQNACLLKITRKQLKEPSIAKQLKAAFPKNDFVSYMGKIRLSPGAFYSYVAGFAVLLAGGSGAFFAAYRLAAKKMSNTWLAAPLGEIVNYRKLFIALHAAIFGLCIVVMLLIYLLPELQTIMLTRIQHEISGGAGPLAVAGKAYLSKNIALAAAITFLINFFGGSILSITILSLFIPGSGVLIAILRGGLWGLLLAPSFADLAPIMLPHSWTLLIEGEAYIVAAFFGLLVPIYLCQDSKGGVGRRYGLAAIMNLRGLSLVAIVLAIAAAYEAIEVILSLKFL